MNTPIPNQPETGVSETPTPKSDESIPLLDGSHAEKLLGAVIDQWDTKYKVENGTGYVPKRLGIRLNVSRELLVAIREQLAAQTRRVEELEAGIRNVCERIPACDETGNLYLVHHDENGEETGIEHVDPIAVINGMDGALRALLTPATEQTNQSTHHE